MVSTIPDTICVWCIFFQNKIFNTYDNINKLSMGSTKYSHIVDFNGLFFKELATMLWSR